MMAPRVSNFLAKVLRVVLSHLAYTRAARTLQKTGDSSDPHTFWAIDWRRFLQLTSAPTVNVYHRIDASSMAVQISCMAVSSGLHPHLVACFTC